MPPDFHTRAYGKLLLTGEYFVLDGAVALAMPVRFGQTLEVRAASGHTLQWRSLDDSGQPWFEATFSLPTLDIVDASDADTARTLQSMLLACRAQNPLFLSENTGLEATTAIDFPRHWGLGTSSTLIAALGRWADADPFRVLADTLGGSGYDIACAYAEGPLLYQRGKTSPVVQPVDFRPVFSQNLWFVYLGKKQDSREGIRRYRALTKSLRPVLARVDRLTERCLSAATLSDFQQVLEEHEALVSHTLELPTVKSRYFPDFPGAVKSLGAWGGDFVLAASAEPEVATRAYFQGKGMETVLGWGEMRGL